MTDVSLILAKRENFPCFYFKISCPEDNRKLQPTAFQTFFILASR